MANDAELKRYRQATEYLGLYGLAAPQRLAQRAAQYDIAEPASVLHVDGQVQSEHVLESRPVHPNAAPIQPALSSIASIASPGRKRTERKTRMLKMNNVGMTSSTRLMMYALM